MRVRYAVLSDIHGNLAALEAVLTDLADAAINRYLCLGDIVGYGARPNQCCDLVRELDAISIRGNHDEAAVDLPCTARAIIYNVFTISGFIANQVKKFAKGEEFHKEIIFDLASMTLLTA